MKIEWLILADAAQVVGGKLYLMGGGWTRLWVNSAFPVQKHIAIAASFQIDWNETNERHPVTIEIASADGKVLATVGGEVEAGRPAGAVAGEAQRVQLAAEMGLTFESSGTYEISARMAGQEPTRLTFAVLPGPMLQMRPQPGQGAA